MKLASGELKRVKACQHVARCTTSGQLSACLEPLISNCITMSSSIAPLQMSFVSGDQGKLQFNQLVLSDVVPLCTDTAMAHFRDSGIGCGSELDEDQSGIRGLNTLSAGALMR